MTVSELKEQCNLEIIHLGNPTAEVDSVYCCDLLSIAMGNAPAGCAWCTVMSNMNTLAVASLTDAACIILCCGIQAEEPMRSKAISENINLFRADKAVFETALDVYNKIK